MVEEMKLVNKETGEPMVEGQLVKTSRGEEFILIGWSTPRSLASEGHVYLARPGGKKVVGSLYASVIGAKFWPRPDRDEYDLAHRDYDPLMDEFHAKVTAAILVTGFSNQERLAMHDAMALYRSYRRTNGYNELPVGMVT